MSSTPLSAPSPFTLSFQIVPYGSELYHQALALRHKILRAPQGLSFSAEDLAQEALPSQIHIAGLQGETVVATCMLVDCGSGLCQMRRVAVDNTHQSQGLGSKMLLFFHQYALAHGFHQVFCHARSSAVPFYQKYGYVCEGLEYLSMGIPHIDMRKNLK
jgi:predicted GNAT family N-acyltransferase